MIETFTQLLKWFNMNLISLNVEKNTLYSFKTRNAPILDIEIGYHNTLITNTLHTEFLCITIENMLLWNTHLNQVITKLSRACYVIRTIKSFMSTVTLITVYHAYFHLLMSYGLIF